MAQKRKKQVGGFNIIAASLFNPFALGNAILGRGLKKSKKKSKSKKK